MTRIHNIPLVCMMLVMCLWFQDALGIAREYYMDKFSDCDRTLNVDDNGVSISGRSMSAPSNPPLSCIIYLRSSYTRNDGSNKLQIEVEFLNIKDCNIKLDLFNGRRSVGEYLKAMSCQQNKVDLIYSKSNEVTVRFTRPRTLFNTEYGFSLTIKPWKDNSVMPSEEGNEKLAIGAIIGIVIGCLVVVVVVILLCWFCCSGRISGKFGDTFSSKPGQVNKGLTEEKHKPPAVVFSDASVWNTNTGGANQDRFQPRYFPRGVPRNDMRAGGGGGGGGGWDGRGGGVNQGGYYNNDRREYDRKQGEGRAYYGGNNAPPNYRPRNDGPVQNYEPDNDRDNNRTNRQPSPRSSPKQQKKNQQQQQRKETTIDDVFDSDSNTQTASDYDDATLQKRPVTDNEDKSSPKSKRKSGPIPEEDKDLKRSPQLERYKSMDLQSQPDTDTITSPVHINAGVRAKVEDELGGSPVGSLRKSKSKPNKGGGKQPDSMAMPPEAFEPIFSGEPMSGINYPHNQFHPGYPGQMAPQYAGGFMPYGLIPSGAFAPGVPGSQTFAYAYQGGGGVGGGGAQGAWVVQNTPTADGNRRTAFAVEETASPERSHRKNGADPFGKSPYRDSGGGSRRGGRNRDRDRGRNGGGGYAPDLSVVTRGAAPPDPGQGHRSVALKSGTDPDTGIHTVQGVWTDTVADPTDPEPGVGNPQITRKTITRVTTKSGHGELPPENDPLIALEAEPAFLSPSSRPSPQAYTPSILPPGPPNTYNNPPLSDSSSRNIDFFTGASGSIPPPERSSTPTSTRPLAPTAFKGAIRDRIPLDDSTV